MARPTTLKEPARLDMRVPKALLSELDRWRGAQPDVPGRSEAIRRLLEIGLRADSHHVAEGMAENGAMVGAYPRTRP